MNPNKPISLLLASIFTLSVSAMAADGNTAADNTKKNARDRTSETKTSGDQSNSPEDIKITQSIRQAVVKDKTLTMTAKNVKIITSGGMVTLRGPVNTAEEKEKIDKLAKATAGEGKVDNQLEVKTATAK
jgi:osmotically-inducible protein OsmY